MSFDFNTITIEDEKLAIAKFKEHEAGVRMGAYQSGDDATFGQLINSELYSFSTIKKRMLDLARTINTNCNDEFLGDLETSFKIKDHKDKTVKFSYLDEYKFLRGVLRFRQETEEYKKKKSQLAEARKFVESNKSTNDKLTEAQALVAKLETEVEAD